MPFGYTTIKSIRDSGVTVAKMSDKKVNELIVFYSNRINSIIGMHFCPISKRVRLSGGSRIIKLSGLAPLIKLSSITIINSDQSRTALDSTTYEPIGKLIKFRYAPPSDVKNVEIDGVFGFLENLKEVLVETTSIIDNLTTTFTVVDASELEVRDVLVFGNRNIIINSIDYNTNTITIDEQTGIKPIPSGSITTCYGSVPSEIEKAVNLLVKNNNTLENQVGGKIKSEKTDDYSYELFENTGLSTGITEVDNILKSFSEDNISIDFL